MREFEWDPAKSEANVAKHGISFMEALALWASPTLEMPTYSGSDDNRFAVYGTISGRYWTAIITYRQGARRIISVRRSRRKEREELDRFKGRQEEDKRGRVR